MPSPTHVDVRCRYKSVACAPPRRAIVTNSPCRSKAAKSSSVSTRRRSCANGRVHTRAGVIDRVSETACSTPTPPGFSKRVGSVRIAGVGELVGRHVELRRLTDAIARLLHDGQMVTVDGARGIVELGA
jgi:hypothetical protein